jgi:hypothetical protein
MVAGNTLLKFLFGQMLDQLGRTSLFCSNAGCSANREILGLETVSHNLCHLVVNANFLFGIRNSDDEREGLRLESLLILDTVSCQQLQFQSPLVTTLAFLSQIAVVGSNRGPFP